MRRVVDTDSQQRWAERQVARERRVTEMIQEYLETYLFEGRQKAMGVLRKYRNAYGRSQ